MRSANPVNPGSSIVFTPESVTDLAARLAWANGEGLKVRVGHIADRASPATGGGETADVLLSLEKLSAPIDHCAGDLVATIAAGASLSDVNDVLKREGQWLPLDPPGASHRTLGAIVATNDSGPRRHRYGTPRDLIIGIEMALADGRIAKAGGRVVKNVAGYDLARMMCGSLGSLAVITGATFKLSPVAQASRTVVIDVPQSSFLSELARAIAAAPVTPSTIELQSPPHRLLVRFETTPAAADRQAAAVVDLGKRYGPGPGKTATSVVVANEEETEVWRAYETGIWSAMGTLLKVSVLPTNVSSLLADLDRSATALGVDYCAGGRAALGVIFFRLRNHAEHHGTIVTELRRAACAVGGSVAIVSADSAGPAGIDRWGDVGDALPLMRAVKARFDPKGTLNPGAGPGGL